MTVSSTEWDITPVNLYNGQDWTQFQATAIYLPPDSYAAIKKFILLECERSKNCPSTSEVTEKINHFEKTFKALN